MVILTDFLVPWNKNMIFAVVGIDAIFINTCKPKRTLSLHGDTNRACL
ncbi:MAG: hypothetical protein RL180_1232, partial [Pseudomonadota bacterium]